MTECQIIIFNLYTVSNTRTQNVSDFNQFKGNDIYIYMQEALKEYTIWLNFIILDIKMAYTSGRKNNEMYMSNKPCVLNF